MPIADTPDAVMFAAEPNLSRMALVSYDRVRDCETLEAATMSTIDRPTQATLPPLEAGQKLERATFHARYEAMPPETRAELISGVVHMPSPLRDGHGWIETLATTLLGTYLRRVPGLRAANNASTFLDAAAEPQPDCQLRILEEFGGQTRVNEDDYIVGPPNWCWKSAGLHGRSTWDPSSKITRGPGSWNTSSSA